jgi:uncharacterized protein YecT (DUF1311 family)
MSDSLAGLESEYQILTELCRVGGSVTYLARHLQLARDVTITVIPDTTEAGRTDLKQVDADVKTLIALRHPNIVPVLEGRWLNEQSFLVVRARVRGSTLDQLLSAIGPVPLPRVKSTLEQVYAALTFARTNGVVARQIAPESLVYQQGSGRVLVAFDAAPPLDGRRRGTGESDDVRTVGRLARIMLSGRPGAGEDRESLAELRPDLSMQVAGAADELAVDGNVADVLAFFAALAAAAGVPNVPMVISPTSSMTPITPSESVPAVPLRRVTVPRTAVGLPPAARVITPASVVPPASRSTPVPQRRFGTGARWATGIGLVVILLAVGALLVLRPQFLSSNAMPVVSPSDSARTATGDVSKQPIIAPATSTPASVPIDSTRRDSAADAPVVSVPSASTPVTTDTTRAAAPTGVPGSPPISAPPSNVTANAACSSTSAADQRKCFSDAVQRADADLNRVYAALIAGLRRQAKSLPEDPDPPTVDKLRAAQRTWLDERDRACQVVGSGVFSGRDRGQCIADRAAKRSRDLQLALDSLPPGM